MKDDLMNRIMAVFESLALSEKQDVIQYALILKNQQTSKVPVCPNP